MKNHTQLYRDKVSQSLLVGLLLFVSTVTLSAQKNRYGMSLSGTTGNYTLTDASKICPLITGGCKTLPADAYLAYAGYQPNLISDNDYAYCTTLTYTYKTYAKYSLTLEVDVPKLTTGPHPFIIWTHGGAWANGSTAAFFNQSRYLASRGIAGVRLTYSVISQGGTFNLGMQELADVFAFVQQHSAEWGLDMTRFGYAGGSAGTPLSSLAAMKQNGNGCKLYMGCNGIYDFQHNLAGSFGDGSSPYLSSYPTKESRDVISAINNIPSNPKNIPAVALFHGSADFTISYLQSVAFCDSIISKGGRGENNIYQYYVHAFFNQGGTDMYEDVILKMYAFAKSVFGTPTVTLPPPTPIIQSVIARFQFTTGENQTKPLDVPKGVVVSDITIGSPIKTNFTANALETSNWGGTNIFASKYVGFEIKSIPFYSFKVNKIDLNMKKTTSTLGVSGIFNYGTTFPPTVTKGVQKSGISTTDYSVVTLMPNATTAAQTDSSLCFGIGIYTGTSLTEVISFDQIEASGEISKQTVTVPTLLSDVKRKSVKTNIGTPLEIPIKAYGELLENTVSVAMEDTSGLFSVDRDYVTISELLNGHVLKVSFSADKVGSYTASLKLQSDEAALSIPITAICDQLNGVGNVKFGKIWSKNNSIYMIDLAQSDIMIFNLLGVRVNHVRKISDYHVITNLKPGVYFVRINGESSFLQKIIIN
ncbi:MAG: prolyl oligopeptidase family serine peptidase [Bacteroidia bacterium]|nr:prolyl oligopeptidase family serine peptidase [Bacteroidia bacterium]